MEELVKARMIEEYLSYEPIKFGDKIDTVYSSITEKTKEWHDLFNKHKLKYELESLRGEYEVAEVYLKSMENCNKKIDSIINNFKPELEGYSIKHVFKHNDKTHTMVFLIDKDLTKVIKSYNE